MNHLSLRDLIREKKVYRLSEGQSNPETLLYYQRVSPLPQFTSFDRKYSTFLSQV